jgi:hypothetical protein
MFTGTTAALFSAYSMTAANAFGYAQFLSPERWRSRRIRSLRNLTGSSVVPPSGVHLTDIVPVSSTVFSDRTEGKMLAYLASNIGSPQQGCIIACTCSISSERHN